MLICSMYFGSLSSKYIYSQISILNLSLTQDIFSNAFKVFILLGVSDCHFSVDFLVLILCFRAFTNPVPDPVNTQLSVGVRACASFSFLPRSIVSYKSVILFRTFDYSPCLPLSIFIADTALELKSWVALHISGLRTQDIIWLHTAFQFLFCSQSKGMLISSLNSTFLLLLSSLYKLRIILMYLEQRDEPSSLSLSFIVLKHLLLCKIEELA